MLITAHSMDDHVLTFDYELDPGTTAFVDRDWITGGEAIPALLVTADRALSWWDGRQSWDQSPSPQTRKDSVAAAASVIAATARASLRAVPTAARSAIEVVGTGMIASTIRNLLGEYPMKVSTGHRSETSTAPLAAIATTRSAEQIMSVAARLAPMGVLVLAGPAEASSTPVNLYKDVHRRGLRMVGIPFDSDDQDSSVLPVGGAQLAKSRVQTTAALWYRLDGTPEES